MMSSQFRETTKHQLVPLFLTVVVAGFLIFLLYLEIHFLNLFTPTAITSTVQIRDILVGLTIYLKTSVDFALFIGNLMTKYAGSKNRIAMELGTAGGNALGTILILVIWDLFKDIKPLLAVMILLAALILLKIAQDSLEHISDKNEELNTAIAMISQQITKALSPVNNFFHIFIRHIIPNFSMKPKKDLTLWGLFALSFTIPFILGLDDFAGYVPLFNIIHVFGFAIGVILGHMFLNIFLFVSPKTTIGVVKNPTISFLGSIALIGLSLWGFFEVYKILFIN